MLACDTIVAYLVLAISSTLVEHLPCLISCSALTTTSPSRDCLSLLWLSHIRCFPLSRLRPCQREQHENNTESSSHLVNWKIMMVLIISKSFVTYVVPQLSCYGCPSDPTLSPAPCLPQFPLGSHLCNRCMSNSKQQAQQQLSMACVSVCYCASVCVYVYTSCTYIHV